MNRSKKLDNSRTEVFKIGKSYIGKTGINTLNPFSLKKVITPLKLLNPPIKPCRIIIGSPSPSSMYLKSFSLLISKTIFQN